MAKDAVTGAARRERLAQRRRELGLTQEALADLLGVERSTVVRWERGETEPLASVRPKLAGALRATADWLDELLASPGMPGRGAAAPRQLPATATGFTGRATELQALTQILDDAADGAPGTVVISAIGGTAGVGKTALALHWAHQVAGRFGDGQLYVNLRGFDPSGAPVSPAEAICGFLDALGVPPGKIPPEPDAQAGMYRSLVADRKMLIVLDNSRDEQQVRPLLPASPASLVLVTSRNQLTGLAAADGARLVVLDVLTQAEAIELLTARLGANRANAEPDAVREIAGLCACLPLALAVAAARATARPRFALAGVAEELRAGRLDALDSGDPAATVRAVFSWSYRQLSPDAARMFRLLGLHPGPDISVPAAASLAATGAPEARRMLRELTRDCLITEHVPGRYTFHDVLRAYAAAQARELDSESDRAAATGRLLDHYLHTAYTAALMLNPSREPIALTPLAPGTTPERHADHMQAMAWSQTEHRVLLASASFAADAGFDSHAWRISWAMIDFRNRAYWNHWVALGRVALDAATRLSDTAGQATCSRLLGVAFASVSDYDQALAYYSTSLGLCQRLGNRLGQAKIHDALSILANEQGRYADALSHAEQELRLCQSVGDKAAEAMALNSVGWCHGLLGDYEQARAFSQQALAILVEAGHRSLEGNVWDSLGYAEHHLGNLSEAVACYRRALSVFQEIGDRFDEADALRHLGDTWLAAGDLPQTREAWQRAIAILDDLGHAGAGEIRAKIDGLPPPVAE